MAKENVMEFFARYDDDEALRERVRLAEEYYPGSLELREPLVEAGGGAVGGGGSGRSRPNLPCRSRWVSCAHMRPS